MAEYVLKTELSAPQLQQTPAMIYYELGNSSAQVAANLSANIVSTLIILHRLNCEDARYVAKLSRYLSIAV